MALSIFQRPNGNVLNPTPVTGSGSNNGGDLLITSANHGLSNTWIYVSSNVSEYNGFFFVPSGFGINSFKMASNQTNTYVQYVKNATITYYVSTYTHGWNAVHLPIQYKLSSTLWPTNSVDTARTVSSYSNDNGYVRLNCSGVLNADISELEFVKVTFTGGTSQVYQVLGVYSTSSVVINLPYVGGLTFVSVQYYYNNYRAQIRVYAGLSSSHRFATQKPYTLITEQSVVPDANGICTLNINEFLKEQIEIIKNDLLSGTLQNNIDAFCQFYITYAEAYDYSTGGYTLLDYVGSYTTDSFVGYAVNADLPFKNIHSGSLSDYVYGWNTGTRLKFLTPSLYPELTPGYFFDISFINQFGNGLRMKIERYLNGSIVNLTFDTIDVYSEGVYRYEVSQSAYLEDRIDLTLQYQDYTGWINVSEVKTITVNSGCSITDTPINLSWLNHLGGFDYWVFKANQDYSIDIETTKTTKKNIYPLWPKSFGEFADSITQQTMRTSRQFIKVRAENLDATTIEDLRRIKQSPLVQIVNSRDDRRTVIVDTASITYLQQGEKLFNMTFNISMTNNEPAQRL